MQLVEGSNLRSLLLAEDLVVNYSFLLDHAQFYQQLEGPDSLRRDVKS